MNVEELAGRIDLSLLRPTVTTGAIKALVRGAVEYPFATVCVPPCHVRLAGGLLKESRTGVSTVIGFPLGYAKKEVKIFEARTAVEDGAGEIDMVMNISNFCSGEFAYVEDEISAVVAAVPGTVVKVIIEACCLTDEEKLRAVDFVIGAGAGFVKTSTGFGVGAATIHDVRLLSKRAAGRIKVKAAGGIKTLQETLAMVDAGAARIGTSSGVEIIKEFLRGD